MKSLEDGRKSVREAFNVQCQLDELHGETGGMVFDDEMTFRSGHDDSTNVQ
jgi:hypothetical protein